MINCHRIFGNTSGRISFQKGTNQTFNIELFSGNTIFSFLTNVSLFQNSIIELKIFQNFDAFYLFDKY